MHNMHVIKCWNPLNAIELLFVVVLFYVQDNKNIRMSTMRFLQVLNECVQVMYLYIIVNLIWTLRRLAICYINDTKFTRKKCPG